MMHGTSRTAKIAGVAALAGLMMAVAILAATRDRTPAPPPTPAIVRDTEGRSRLNRELERCATLTMPDSGCEAAWAENRRRFFHQDEPEGAGR